MMSGFISDFNKDKRIKEGFVFNGFDTRENNMYLTIRHAPTPINKEIIEEVPFAQGVYDFSNILGERLYGNRIISYDFELPEYDYNRRKHIQTYLQNKLMNAHIQKIEDTHDPSYYYLGKCISVNVGDDNPYGRLLVTVEFDCYPFKISKLPEGHDIWDEFNFELDVAQETTFELAGLTPDIELNIGDRATSNANTQRPENTGLSKRIVDKRPSTTEGNRFTYLLEGNSNWFADYKIIEAYSSPHEITLINNGTASVLPNISATDDFSILLENTVYNFDAPVFENQIFRLQKGTHKLKVFNYTDVTLKFDFHKELI